MWLPFGEVTFGYYRSSSKFLWFA